MCRATVVVITFLSGLERRKFVALSKMLSKLGTCFVKLISLHWWLLLDRVGSVHCIMITSGSAPWSTLLATGPFICVILHGELWQ